MSDNEHTLDRKISRPATGNWLMKLSGGLHSFVLRFNRFTQLMGNRRQQDGREIQDELILSSDKHVQVSRHVAVISLMNSGKSYDEAELIINTMEEWGLDLSMADSMKFKVIGDAVWIDQED